MKMELFEKKHKGERGCKKTPLTENRPGREV